MQYLPLGSVLESVFGVRRQVADFDVVKVLDKVVVAHPELAVVFKGQAHVRLLVVRHSAPLVRAVSPGSLPLNLVAPRVPDADERDLALEVCFRLQKNI